MTNREGVLSDAEAGYGQGLVPGPRPALIMIDFARAYFEPGAGFYMGRDDCLASAEQLLESARAAGVHVVHTKVAYAEGGIDGGYFFKKFAPLSAFVGESELGETMPQVMPLPHELVITKQYASAFFGTSLSSYLTSHGVDTLIIAGVSTSGCVRATAVDAVQHGFIPLVVRDAVGDRADGPHLANLYDLQAKYAEVVSEQAALDYLESLRGSGLRS